MHKNDQKYYEIVSDQSKLNKKSVSKIIKTIRNALESLKKGQKNFNKKYQAQMGPNKPAQMVYREPVRMNTISKQRN